MYKFRTGFYCYRRNEIDQPGMIDLFIRPSPERETYLNEPRSEKVIRNSVKVSTTLPDTTKSFQVEGKPKAKSK